MRAVAMRTGRLALTEMCEPEVLADQLLLEPISAGVCGGDLNALEHTDEFLHASRASGTQTFLFDPDRDLVFGHEFTARVAAVGSAVEAYAPGDVILASPAHLRPGDYRDIEHMKILIRHDIDGPGIRAPEELLP